MCFSQEFVSLAFSPDSKLLMAQGGSPDWTLTIWTWEKAKFVASIKTAASQNSTIYQCSFCPTDNNLICVTGNGVFKQLKLVDSTLKVLPNALNKREPQNYLCHAWLSDERVVLGTDTGDLLLVDSLELKAFIPRAPSDSNSIEAVVGFSKVIVLCACSCKRHHLEDFMHAFSSRFRELVVDEHAGAKNSPTRTHAQDGRAE
jgi:hypothetical protein